MCVCVCVCVLKTAALQFIQSAMDTVIFGHFPQRSVPNREEAGGQAAATPKKKVYAAGPRSWGFGISESAQLVRLVVLPLGLLLSLEATPPNAVNSKRIIV